MTRKSAMVYGVAAVLVALLAPLAAAQEPDPAKVAARAVEQSDPDKVDPNLIKGETWTFDFRFDHPQPLVVTTPGGEKEVYWYLVYTVTSRAAKEKTYIPTFTLFSDTAVVRRAGIFPTVFEAIKKNRKIRFLENAVKMHGKVLPGDDNARTGVAIFAPLDRNTDRFTIFCEGLSGRYIERCPKCGGRRIRRSESEPHLKCLACGSTPADEKVIRLRKTLAITYKLPGDKWWLNQDQVIFVSKKWTWR